MKVTLTDNEIRATLLESAHKKVDYAMLAHVDDTYFYIEAEGKEVNDVESVEFIVDFGVMEARE